LKTTKALHILVLSLMFTTTAMARPGGGADIGGGDTVRAIFLNAGDAVITYLTENADGQKLVAEQGLKIENLQKSLDVKVIKVVDDALVDRTGSLVEALGQPGEITLNKISWAQHLERETDIYFLVFHEMLRENGINDDNYVISKALLRFPENLKLKKVLITNKELVDSDRLSDVIQKDKIKFGGPGCPSTSLKTFTRFDSASNQFEIYPNEMATVVGSNSRVFDRTSCQLAIPYKAKAGKKILITQIDLVGDLDLEKLKAVKVSFDSFTVGGKVNSQVKDINSGSENLSQGFLFRENLTTETACGGEGILRLNSNILLQDNSRQSTSKASYAKVSRIAVSLKSVDCTLTTKK
jgi:hypothetical protein